MIVQPLDALKERLRESRLFNEEKLQSVCSGPKWDAAQDIPQALRALVASKALTAWQAQMLYAGKTTLRFGNYILLDRLSQDPQNRTFLAEHDSMGRKVALKQLSRQHTQNERVSKTFLNKVRAFARVNHPRIVHLFDVAQDHGRFYVVKELVEGENLAAAVASLKTVPRERACRWIAEIAEGVQALHDNGIAHLDLHPGTIVVQKDGSIKILEPGTYETGQSPAHAAYLAPEVQSDEGSPAADLYSLGMLAHLALTGAPRTPGSVAPAFESEIAVLTGSDVAARASAAAKLREASRSMAEASAPVAAVAYEPAEIVEAEEILEAEAYEDAIDPLDAPFDPLGAGPLDPLGAGPLGPAAPLGGGDFFADLDAAAAMATSSQPLAMTQPQLGTAAAAAAGFGPPLGGFPGIQTGGERNGAAGPGRASKSGTFDAKGEPAAPATEKKGGNGLIIGLAATCGALAVLLLVGVIGAVIFFATGSDSDQVAQNDGPQNVTPTKATNNAAATAGGGNAAASDPAAETPATSEAAPAEEEVEDPGFQLTFPLEEEQAANAAAAAVAAAANAPGANPEGAATPAPSDPPAGAPPAEGAPAPAAPAATDVATTTPNPAPEAPATPAPTPDPATAPVATAGPAAGDMPKPANDIQNPFRETPKAVDLPPWGVGEEAILEPLTLTPIHLNPQDLLQVELQGGGVAMKGNQKFTLEAARGGLLPNEWEIRLTGSSALKDDNEIAHVALVQSEFQFRWTDRAQKEPNSAYLKNCALLLRTGIHAAVMDLRKPLEMEPAMIASMEPAKIQIPISEVADLDTLTLRVLGMSVPFDYHVANESLKADKDTTMIRFGRDGDVPAYLNVDVAASKKQVTIVLTPVLQFSNAPRPDVLKPNMAERMLQGFAVQAEQLKAANAQIDAFKSNYDKSPQDVKNRLKPQMDAMNAQKPQNATAIEQIEKATKELNKAKPAIDQFAQGATFHYRLTVGSGDGAPVLAFTPPPEKKQVVADEGEKKKD